MLLFSPKPNFDKLREAMVRDQLEARGIRDEKVLNAFLGMPRHLFVPRELEGRAYEDGPLSIGDGQTISQPLIVAQMICALSLRDSFRVLEIGGGSGYAAALLSKLAKEVFVVERNARLAGESAERLKHLGCSNARVIHGDGTLGFAEASPYDAILVSAAGPKIPAALLDQLKPGGALVIPLGPDGDQRLLRVVKGEDGALKQEYLGAVRFVPLIGQEGWREG